MSYPKANQTFRLIHSLETLLYEDEMQVNKINYCLMYVILVVVVACFRETRL